MKLYDPVPLSKKTRLKSIDTNSTACWGAVSRDVDPLVYPVRPIDQIKRYKK